MKSSYSNLSLLDQGLDSRLSIMKGEAIPRFTLGRIHYSINYILSSFETVKAQESHSTSRPPAPRDLPRQHKNSSNRTLLTNYSKQLNPLRYAILKLETRNSTALTTPSIFRLLACLWITTFLALEFDPLGIVYEVARFHLLTRRAGTLGGDNRDTPTVSLSYTTRPHSVDGNTFTDFGYKGLRQS
ncbi:hypothetical protein BJX76DRAFT_135236 [Aspergillus varians]